MGCGDACLLSSCPRETEAERRPRAQHQPGLHCLTQNKGNPSSLGLVPTQWLLPVCVVLDPVCRDGVPGVFSSARRDMSPLQGLITTSLRSGQLTRCRGGEQLHPAGFSTTNSPPGPLLTSTPARGEFGVWG